MPTTQNVIENIITLSGIPLSEDTEFVSNEIEKLSKTAVFNITLPNENSTGEQKMKSLIDILGWLDANNELSDWILDHPISPGDDLDEFLPDSLNQRLSQSKALLFRVLAMLSFALGLAWSEMGNRKHTYHMFVCAIHVFERLVRTTPRKSKAYQGDVGACQIIYTQLLKLAIEFKSYEVAIEYGNKLVTLNDTILAELQMENDITELEIELAPHYNAQLSLASAAEKHGDTNVLIHALVRAIEILRLNELKKGNEMIVEDSRLEQFNLCLRILRSNDRLKGDASISIKHACLAKNLIKEFESNHNLGNDTAKNARNSFEIAFLAGKAHYKYALQLAGGPTHASSPPIPVMKWIDGPSMKDLLNDAVQFFLEAENIFVELPDVTLRTISIQLAIIYTELREETKARKCLELHNVYPAVINYLAPSKMNDENTPADLKSILSSPEVLKRIISLCPQAVKSGNRTRPVLHRISSRLGARAPAITCAYCLMAVRDPIHCDSCSVSYCTEECKLDHREEHSVECTRTAIEHMWANVGDSLPFFN